MSKIVVTDTREEDFEDYYLVRCSPGDIYWNGYEERPEKTSFRKLFMRRLSSSPFQSPEDRRLYLIKLKENEAWKTIGFTQLIRRQDCVEIGYTIVEAYQRHGYATEALKQTVQLAKEHMSRICVRIRDDNVASQGVALKNNFVPTDEYSVQKYPQAGEVKLRIYQYICDN